MPQLSPKALVEIADTLRDTVSQVLLGKDEVIETALIALLCEGHLLVEDVPGTGKTTLARALAAAVGGRYSRIQFTPDLLPADVTGTSVFDARTRDFEFHPGPVFANVVLADEINRASPKTQSALLEVMEERQVTTDGVATPVPRPFVVLATQNPVDMDGTYRLPEAQLDRFMMRISIGYPDPATEAAVLAGRRVRPDNLSPVIATEHLLQASRTVEGIHTSPELCCYVVDLVTVTRGHQDLRLGVSPRGALALIAAAKARAAVRGRQFVTPDDVKAMAHPVLAHRLLLGSAAQVRGATQAGVLDQVLASVATPRALRSA